MVTTVSADLQLHACDFTGSQAKSGKQGLVGSYINGSVLPLSLLGLPDAVMHTLATLAFCLKVCPRSI